MSSTVILENYGTSPLASVLFTKSVAVGASKTVADARTVDIDIYLADYDRASNLGAYIDVDGTLRAGSAAVSAITTLADADRVIKADTDGGAYSLTLMPIANVPVGTVLFINFHSDGGDLTLDGNAAEEIDAATTLVLTDVGIVRLTSDGTAWTSDQ